MDHSCHWLELESRENFRPVTAREARAMQLRGHFFLINCDPRCCSFNWKIRIWGNLETPFFCQFVSYWANTSSCAIVVPLVDSNLFREKAPLFTQQKHKSGVFTFSSQLTRRCLRAPAVALAIVPNNPFALLRSLLRFSFQWISMINLLQMMSVHNE